MKVNVSLKGVDTVLRNLKKEKERRGKALTRGIKKAAAFLLRESKKVVPVDTGELRRSGFWRIRWAGTMRAEAVIGYTKEYAIWVHERLDLRHKPGKIAKFLEVPAKRFGKKMQDIIAAEVKKG